MAQNMKRFFYKKWTTQFVLCMVFLIAMLSARLGEGRDSPPPIPAATDLQCNLLFFEDESCPEKNDGVIVIFATGGTGPYIYTLGFRTNNTGVFSNLPAGDHQITIKDWLNNEVTCDIITITEPDPISANVISVENETCNENNDGSITFEAQGGTPPYSYDNGLETNSTGTFDDLPSGFYRVTITDISSCRGISPLVEVTQPWPLACVVRNIENETCPQNNDGLIEIEGAGGTSPYVYTLNGVSNTNGIFSNLDAGQYEVEITDTNNCTVSCNRITVTEGDNIPPSISCPPQMFGVCSLNELPPYNSLSEFTNDGGSVNDNVAIDASAFRLVEENIGATTCPVRVSRVYEIADMCGNTARCVHSIVIDDEDPPTITCPPGGVVVCIEDVPEPYDNIDEFILDGGEFEDNCSVDESSFRLLFQSIQTDPNHPNCPISVTRIYDIRDNCNNNTSCAQVISLEDNNNPTMNMPPSENAICSIIEVPPYDFSTFVSAGGSVDDNCEVDQSTFTYNGESSDGNSCPEIVTREYQISDVCGNIVLGFHRVIINDDVAPSINCPATINVQCDISEIPPYSNLIKEVLL